MKNAFFNWIRDNRFLFAGLGVLAIGGGGVLGACATSQEKNLNTGRSQILVRVQTQFDVKSQLAVEKQNLKTRFANFKIVYEKAIAFNVNCYGQCWNNLPTETIAVDAKEIYLKRVGETWTLFDQEIDKLNESNMLASGANLKTLLDKIKTLFDNLKNYRGEINSGYTFETKLDETFLEIADENLAAMFVILNKIYSFV